MDLFSHSRQEQIEREAPLAARMRPRTLDEYVGQEHVVGPGRLLRRAIQADQLSSLIFYGPPGTGKTTLAMVIANTTRSTFVTMNAVLAGVKDVREVVKKAQDDRNLYSQRTILFVDEVHRWNKAQQDALLPWVENGTIIMIGATTENPYFTVNRPLLSRSRVFQLVPLTDDDLHRIAQAALLDETRGYGTMNVRIDENALDHLVSVSNGDARSLLNAIELAVETTQPDEQSAIRIDVAVAEESIQKRAVLYDREGDYHFDTISAFIKSLRGSDPDAALYWLAKMVYAGEDPRFIFRRMLILASEDVGLADPNAIGVVEACAATFERVGLPEGQFHLAEAALYLATTPKSNSVMAYFDALEMVKQERQDEVPSHLKDASRDKESFGHGQGYLYPHAYRDHWVAQQYLPAALQGKLFYQPSNRGYEQGIRDQVHRRREEQLAAMIEGPDATGEILTYTYADPAQERWLQRAIGNYGQRLAQIRERIFASLPQQRHSLILDLNAGTGLLTWEALRQAPEGGVWALAKTEQEGISLNQQAAALEMIERPIVLWGSPEDAAQILAGSDFDRVRFDVIIGRNCLLTVNDKAMLFGSLCDLLLPQGRLSLAEAMPRYTQRLYALLPHGVLEDGLATHLKQAEEAIYSQSNDPMTNWDESSIQGALNQSSWHEVRVTAESVESERQIIPGQIERWFRDASGARPSYAQHLSRYMTPEELLLVEAAFRRHLAGQTVTWTSRMAYITAVRASEQHETPK